MLPKVTGLGSMIDIPWGTHFCFFYETKQELLDALVPFFLAGLENNEFCLWVIYKAITEADALEAMRAATPHLDRYLAENRLAILVHPGLETPEQDNSLTPLYEQLASVMARGLEGMRLAGSPMCLQRMSEDSFREFEWRLGQAAANNRLIALCHFPVADSTAAEILDAARSHRFVMARREGEWKIIETVESRRAHAAITKLNEQLERRVEERTRELEAANEELRKEIAWRERAEEDLRRQKEILQTIFDHIPLMVNFGNEAGELALVNREWERTLGWSLEEVLQGQVDILAENYPDPEYREKVRDFVFHVTGEWRDFKTHVRDGRVIDTSWIMLRLPDRTSIGIGQDITWRKRAEEALRESEERFRQFAENIHDLFWIKSPDFNRTLYLSPAYATISGRSPEERYADQDYQPFLNLIHPEDRGRMLQIIESGLSQEFDIEFRVLRGDGSWRWIHDRGFPIRDASGRVSRIAGVATDITERKLADEALRDSEERFRQLAENIHEVFWLRSPDLRHLLYVSPLCEKVCGKLPEGIENDGMHLEVVHPEDRERLAEMMWKRGGQEFEIEYRILTKDGGVRWLRDRGFPIRNQAGEIYRVGGVAEDITERKETEERLKATSDQLRALSASLQSAREAEATRIAHQIHDDMGGVLSALRWELEALEKMIHEPGDPSRLKTAMQTKLAAMLSLTDNTINVVRRIASDLRPSILDDLGLMEAIEWQAEQFEARTGIHCRCDHALQDNGLGEREATAVFRILQEALTNILRHAQATRVDIAMKEEGGVFVLRVADNGRGITEAEKLSRDSVGILGMRERAHLIGAEVDISGENGVGTTLQVRVPLARRRKEAARAKSADC